MKDTHRESITQCCLERDKNLHIERYQNLVFTVISLLKPKLVFSITNTSIWSHMDGRFWLHKLVLLCIIVDIQISSGTNLLILHLNKSPDCMATNPAGIKIWDTKYHNQCLR